MNKFRKYTGIDFNIQYVLNFNIIMELTKLDDI